MINLLVNIGFSYLITILILLLLIMNAREGWEEPHVGFHYGKKPRGRIQYP